MGLDAIVFNNWEGLRPKLSGDHYSVDPDTGEVYVKDDSLATTQLSPSFVQAFSARIGNVAEVGYLTSVLSQTFAGRPSIICDRILSGLGGDKVEASELPILRADILAIMKTELMQDDSVSSFVGKLQALVEAAEQQRNPIVLS